MGCFPKPLYVAHRGNAKDAFVFPTEVRGISISDTVGDMGSIEVFAQHQAPGFLQAHALQELQGRDGGHGLEVLMKARDAHTRVARNLLTRSGLSKSCPSRWTARAMAGV